jgi:type II secretory pathway pseudopilin PulG
MAAGYSLIELVFVMGLAATLSAIAVPQSLSALDDTRAAGAARYIAARLQRARTEAIARSTTVGVKFTLAGSHYSYAMYADGNGNGIRTADIATGVDGQLLAAERLVDQFTSVDFGTLPGLPAVDAGGAPPGSDPVHLGASNIASFTPQATATAGSIYIRGARAQYVVRIYNDTARTRILKFDAVTNRWRPL